MGNLKAGTQGEWKEEEDDGEGEGGEDEAKKAVPFVVGVVVAAGHALAQLFLPDDLKIKLKTQQSFPSIKFC